MFGIKKILFECFRTSLELEDILTWVFEGVMHIEVKKILFE